NTGTRDQTEPAMPGHALPDRANQNTGPYASPRSPELHIGFIWRAVHAHHQREPGHALPTDKADLYAPVVGSTRDDGGKPTVDEIEVIDPTIAVPELTPQGKIDGLQVGLKKAEVLWRATKEDS